MPHAPLAPLPTFRAVVTGSKKPFRYKRLPPARLAAISLDTVKARLGIAPSDTSFDSLIGLITDGVTLFAENYTGLTFINQVWETFRDFFTPSFELRRAPILSSVVVITYFNLSGSVVAVDSSLFGRTDTIYQRVFLLDGQSWPSDKQDRPEAIRLRFTAGFGAAETDIPADLRMAMLSHIVSVFAKAGDCCDAGLIPNTALDTYKQHRILSLKIVHSEG